MDIVSTLIPVLLSIVLACSTYTHLSTRPCNLSETATLQGRVQVRAIFLIVPAACYLCCSHPISNLAPDQCGNPIGISGTFNFKGLVAAGFLNSTGEPADGIDYRYDNCSQTVGISFILSFLSFGSS